MADSGPDPSGRPRGHEAARADTGGTDRDRNAYGRAENQRPRDRTGRPLPYDTSETALAEEHEYDTVEEALATAVRLWNDRRYFEAHECLEDVWHHAPADERDFWQGVIQVAVACVHQQRGNPQGVTGTCGKVLRRLSPYPDAFHGVDVGTIRRWCTGWQQTGSIADLPDFPAVGQGPWFDRARDRTPLTRQPPWLVAARARAGTTDVADASEREKRP